MGQGKEISFCNKAKIFSSFLHILIMYFIMQNSHSLKVAFDFVSPYLQTFPAPNEGLLI